MKQIYLLLCSICIYRIRRVRRINIRSGAGTRPKELAPVNGGRETNRSGRKGRNGSWTLEKPGT